MLQGCDYRKARDAMLEQVGPVGTETAALSACAGRVLARQVVARADIPPFDRSPYDGYAFRSQDVQNASEQSPVTLRIVDYIAAGDVPHTCIRAGEAAHLMTGAPVPEGADAVLPFERPRIDAGLAGTLAGQGIFTPCVYRKPLVGVISTGSEILEENEEPSPGHIYNSNRYSLQTACELAGCRTVYIGTAGDDRDVIAGLIGEAFRTCDAVILSGGVSVGDFDCTPEAMVLSGVRLLAHGLALKPGMAGAYGIYDRSNENVPSSGDKGPSSGENGPSSGDNSSYSEDGSRTVPVFGLSGNPAACMTAFYAVVLPVLRRQMGFAPGACLPPQIRVRLSKDYSRKNQSARLLRGKVDLTAVVQEMEITGGQGNQVLSSVAGSNAFAEIPAGETVQAQETVHAFLMGEF